MRGRDHIPLIVKTPHAPRKVPRPSWEWGLSEQNFLSDKDAPRFRCTPRPGKARRRVPRPGPPQPPPERQDEEPRGGWAERGVWEQTMKLGGAQTRR